MVLKKEKEKERSSRASHTKFISSLRIQINLEQTVASGQATLAKTPYHSLYKHIFDFVVVVSAKLAQTQNI